MRIGVVNDSRMAVEALRRVLAGVPAYDIAWVARDGAEAVLYCQRDKPDIVLMDLEMPGMDGTEATRRIMAETPCAILIVTGTVEGHAAKVFETLGAGALDVVKTPVFMDSDDAAGAGILLEKIRLLGRLVHSSHRHNGKLNLTRLEATGGERIVVIGASAGGPAAVANVLGCLPADFPLPIVIVQHVDAQFAGAMARWLNDQTLLTVRPAQDGDHLKAGVAYLAATDDHLILAGINTLGYTPEPTDATYRPSIDIFFESVARLRKERVIGVLLTGMGKDGAKGLKQLRDVGATTIAQDRETSVVYGMPKQAATLNAAMEILPLDQIGPRLIHLSTRQVALKR